jgi:hypothetical protein
MPQKHPPASTALSLRPAAIALLDPISAAAMASTEKRFIISSCVDEAQQQIRSTRPLDASNRWQ